MECKIHTLSFWARISTLCLIVVSFNIKADDNYFTATYKGKLSGFSVTTQRTLTHTGNNEFNLTSEAKNGFASIEETSLFKKIDSQFIPTQYTYHRKIIGMQSKQYIHFDWDTLIAQYTRKDKPKKNTTHKLEKGLLDPSLYQLKLQQDLNAKSTTFYYQYPKEWKIKTMEFAITKETTFELNQKNYKAIELERINQPDKKRTQIIVIPELFFQIAKITHTEENGKQYALTLNKFTYDKEKLAHFYRHKPSTTVNHHQLNKNP